MRIQKDTKTTILTRQAPVIKLIKDDINFLENPLWSIDEQSKNTEVIVEKPNGMYRIKSATSFPTKLDKLILYIIQYELFKRNCLLVNGGGLTLTLTRYALCKEIFLKKHIGQQEYDRLMLALERWKGLYIEFNGIFYEEQGYSTRFFSILNTVIVHHKTKDLYIEFNDQYMKQQAESTFYQNISIETYRKLRAVSARLYEILVKSFLAEPVWYINIENLASKIPLKKREGVANYYKSDILAALKPAVSDINMHANFKITLEYNSESGVCTFTRIDQRPYVGQSKKAALLTQIGQKGLTSGAKQEIVKTTLQDEESVRQKNNRLKLEFNRWLENKAQTAYESFSKNLQETIDKQFEEWLLEQKQKSSFLAPTSAYRTSFLIRTLLKDEDMNFELWEKNRGVSL